VGIPQLAYASGIQGNEEDFSDLTWFIYHPPLIPEDCVFSDILSQLKDALVSLFIDPQVRVF
jgi:hypothetical protein